MWGQLDDQLGMDFDHVKLVAFEIGKSSFEDKNFEDMTPRFWLDRQLVRR